MDLDSLKQLYDSCQQAYFELVELFPESPVRVSSIFTLVKPDDAYDIAIPQDLNNFLPSLQPSVLTKYEHFLVQNKSVILQFSKFLTGETGEETKLSFSI